MPVVREVVMVTVVVVGSVEDEKSPVVTCPRKANKGLVSTFNFLVLCFMARSFEINLHTTVLNRKKIRRNRVLFT